jgi:hypothetical protein
MKFVQAINSISTTVWGVMFIFCAIALAMTHHEQIGLTVLTTGAAFITGRDTGKISQPEK